MYKIGYSSRCARLLSLLYPPRSEATTWIYSVIASISLNAACQTLFEDLVARQESPNPTQRLLSCSVGSFLVAVVLQ